MTPEPQSEPALQCGGLMPTPLVDGQGYVCRNCDRKCTKRSKFFEFCPILAASDLEPREAGEE